MSDPKEIQIVSKAKQKNVRDPNRPRSHFDQIFSDFLNGVNFENQKIIDLGPGQYDFGEIARNKGANVSAFDIDPAVYELGLYKGFDVVQGDLMDIESFRLGEFDGVFSKFSINAFWFDNAEDVEQYTLNLKKLLKPNAWAWIGPWNGFAHRVFTPEMAQKILEVQIRSFESIGFKTIELSQEQMKRYGLTGKVENNVVFTRCL